MPAVAELDLPAFDPTDPDLRGPRFHATMRELAERSWLARTAIATVVLDREVVSQLLRSKALIFPGKVIAEMFGVTEGPLHEEIHRNILCIDGDDHRRLRTLVNPAFTPRAAQRWRERMRTELAAITDELGDRTSCDAVETVAKPYPARMIAALMGAPREDAARLAEWSYWIQGQFAADLLEQRPRIEQAVEEFYAYVDALLERRRREPADDLVSTLIAAEEAGDRLSDVEVVNLVLNVLIGGVDTTQSQLAHALRLLAEHPEQQRLVREDPSLVPAAIDEVLRFEPIVPFTARLVLEDTEIRDVTFPAGTVLLLSAVTANRDPDAYDEPDVFDLTKDRRGEKPLTFGAGIHYCMGANLARAELEEGLTHLLPRWRDLRLDGEPAFGSVNGIYGLDALPLRWSAA